MHRERWWPKVNQICKVQYALLYITIYFSTYRYSIGILAKDPVDPTNGEEPATIQLVFFGPTAEELIGVPVDSLLSSHGNQSIFLPTRITNLYGRQFELRISVSPRSLQRQDISYQVDTILGVINQPVQLPLPNIAGKDIIHNFCSFYSILHLPHMLQIL